MSPKTIASAFAALAIIATAPLAYSQSQASGARFSLIEQSSAPKKIVIRDALWICGENGCATAKVNSRAEIVCETVARKLGRIASMTVAGVALSDTQLEKCNVKAK